ncbi:MAG: ester cyclase [Candidatus Bathyarchaeia archaeon]|jgi:predicted SnoaL-like aldol condensation-catalyzing enzyme
MQEKENVELVAKALGAVLNGHDLKAIDQYWTEGYIQHNPMVKTGREPFKEFAKGWINAMPDLKWEPILQPVGSEDQVWAYGKYTGTFQHDWMGIKANGKKIAFTAVDIVRVEKGKIAEHWDVMDLKTMFDQMGAK